MGNQNNIDQSTGKPFLSDAELASASEKLKDYLSFQKYQRKGLLSEMRPYVSGEDLTGISVSPKDTPEEGGMIARNPEDHNDKWYVSKKYFKDNLELAIISTGEKSLGNTDASGAKVNVKDIVFWGDGDAWKLLGKASSKNEGWMKSSKAYEIPGIGCIVQVTTQQNDNVAEALTIVYNTKIEETKNDAGVVVSRKLISSIE